MASYSLLVAAFCLIAVVAAQEPPSVELDMQELVNGYGVPGDNVTFTCRATNLVEGDSVWWFKMVHQGEAMHVNLIATNDNKLPPYSSFARYITMPAVTMSDTVTLYTMHIYGLMGEDTGHVGCSYGEVEREIYSAKDLMVYQEQTSMELAVQNKTGQTNITVSSKETVSVSCGVHEVLPAPRFTITLGDRDVTEDFMQVQDTTAQCLDSAINRDCSLHFNYDVTMKTHQFAVRPEDSGQMLTCTSRMMEHQTGGRRRRTVGGDKATLTAQIQIFVLHAPVVSCASEHKAKLSARDVRIECRVTANPPLNDSMWHFTLDGDDEMIHGEGSAALTGVSAGIDGDSFYININRVKEKHFTTYELHVTSAEGETRGQTKLVQDHSTEPPAGAAAGLFTTRWMALLVMLLLFAH